MAAELGDQGTYDGGQLTVRVDEGASITVPPGAARDGSTVTVTAVAPASLPELPDYVEKPQQVYDFDVEGGVRAPVTVRIPAPATDNWMLLHYTGGEWVPTPFELVGDEIVATVDSLSILGIFKSVCDFLFSDSCRNAAFSLYNTVRDGLDDILDPSPDACANPDDRVRVENDSANDLLHGCATVRGSDSGLVVQNVRRFYLDVYPGAASTGTFIGEGSLFRSCCDNGLILGPGEASVWSSDLSRAPLDIEGRFSTNALLAQTADILLSVVPGLGVVDDELLGIAIHVIQSALNERRGDSMALDQSPAEAINSLVTVVADVGFLKDVAKVLGERIEQKPELLARLGIKVAKEFFVVFTVIDIADALSVVNDIANALEDADDDRMATGASGVGGSVRFSSPWVAQAGERISAGFEHSCAVGQDDRVACWGNNGSFQAEPPPSWRFKQVSAGGSHSCGVRASNRVACWGYNGSGQADAPPTWQFSQVSAGGSHSCGVREGGRVACWGNNAHGQADAPRGTFSQVSAGSTHTCGVREDGSAVCWGNNADGRADAPTGQFRQVSAGSGHSCGVLVDGSAVCWGSNVDSQGVRLGQADASSGQFRQVSAGSLHSCGVRTNGIAVCWGYNGSGRADAPGGWFAEVSAGFGHSCGVRQNGAAVCWGANDDGQANAPSGLLVRGFE